MDWQKNSQQLKDAFDRDGFVVIPRLLHPGRDRGVKRSY